MRIALYQPDIPQNTGNIFRLGACLGVSVDIIEPTGFIFDDKKFKRSAISTCSTFLFGISFLHTN